jgi:acyl-CoA hydrolase
MVPERLPDSAPSPPREPRSQAASTTTMTEYVLPQHSNVFGGVFGGQIMAWVDLSAAICAQRHAGRQAVTAYVDDLRFELPVRVGEVVRLIARVTATFRTSMEITVVVTGEDTLTGRTWPCVRARTVFVAIGEDGKPTRVPPLLLEDEATRESQAAGEARRAKRLAR